MPPGTVLLKECFNLPLKNRDRFRDKIFRILNKNFNNSLSHQLVYVIDELISNTEEYGYEGKGGEVKLKIVKFKNHLSIEIMDKGRKPPLTKENKIDWDRVIKRGRGLGLYSVRKILDSLDFLKKGSWNIYRGKKKIK